ncbi:MAG: penicillin-binding protein 1A [Oleiphilaceae bacterium]|nr:penicillin-binding protein 1A [Oleiphilaceae bacterium]
MPRFVRLSTFLGWAFALLICGAGVVITSFFLYLTPGLPEAQQLKNTQLQTPLRIYSQDNKRIAEFGEKRRTPISVSDVPQDLINAFIAAEDNRFFEHKGIDIKGLLRATTQLISSGRIKSGGSTITMQVAKNFFLSRERTFTRKFNEIFLAIQIEQTLSKGEILELYLNKIYLGNRAYGIHAAAQVYYGKSIKELSLAEAAMIAGLPKAPSAYNPLANPERALIRRNWILDRMLELGMVSVARHQEAISESVTASFHGGKPELEAPYAAEMARLEIIKRFGSDAYTAGYTAYLTINSALQRAANQALKSGLDAYDRRHGYRGPLASIPPQKLEADDDKLVAHLHSIKSASHHTPGLVLSTENDTAVVITRDRSRVELDATAVEWAAPYVSVDQVGPKPTKPGEILNPGDIILLTRSSEDQWVLAQTPQAQGALISLSAENGAIQAITGGYDFGLSHYNRATQAKRQPGSSLKPFIYLAALEQGATAATLINDAPIVFDDKNLETAWRPENSSGKFYGPTRLRKALYNSRNLVSIRLLKQTGITPTIDTLRRFGFDPNALPRDLSLALGSAGVTPMDIARGYAIIANGGHYIEPFLIARIEDAEGNIVYEADPLTVCDQDCQRKSRDETAVRTAPRIADERAVYILHSMLKDVIKKGTGRRAQSLKRSDIAGKTGTTNDQKDAWFAGFNTRIATTAWVGFDSPSTLGRREYGARAALPVWADYMQVALKDTAESHMRRPSGLVTVRINPETGEAAQPGDRNAIFELFRNEQAPKANTITPPERNTGEQSNQALSPEDIF